jgi:hypothetical protein
MATDSSLHRYAPVDGCLRPPGAFGVAADGVPVVISDGGSVPSPTSFPA